MSTELCVLLVRGEEQPERSREVGCQWEEEEEVRRRDVGCQSDPVDRRDAEVQVDLLSQQLGWTQHTGSPAMLLQCLVRPDGPEGGALLQHCASKQTSTGTRTRTRTVQPPVKLSPTLTKPRPRTPRRPPTLGPAPDQSANPSTRCRRRRQPPRRLRHSTSEGEEGEGEEQQEEEEQQQQQQGDRGDPAWTPPEEAGAAAVSRPPVASRQRDPLRAVKQESDGDAGATCCPVCGKVLKSRSSLARHSFIHTGQRPFACTLCPLRFNRRDNLRHHLARLHPQGAARPDRRRPAPRTWLCAACGKTFGCRSRLRSHELIHSGVKPHRCPRCPKAYMRSSDLEHHRRVVHGEGGGRGDGAPPSPPPASSSLLCHLCGREFRCRSQLAAHLRGHSGERPHLCDACGRSFARRYQLRRHALLVHGGGEENRPPQHFACPTCGRRLRSEAQLAAHRARLHGERARPPSPCPSPFPCPLCHKAFRFRSLLASHALVHSEQRPHACDLCPRRFRRAAHLRRHRRALHADGRRRPPQSFVCGVCGLDKKCRSQLARHAIIHTGERPHACDLCPARFNRPGNLKQHRRRVHGVAPSPPPAGREEEEEEAAGGATPVLFDDDADDVISYKQEEAAGGGAGEGQGAELLLALDHL